MSLLSDIGTAIKNKLGGTSVDNTVPRYDGTTCKLQGSGVTISDTNAVTASGGFVGNLTGNASTATKLTSSQDNWSASGVIDNVVGMLVWKQWGNYHVVFDASKGTSPSGSAIDKANAQYPWIPNSPTLMGWNGSNTFGVRVDAARASEAFTTAVGSAPSYACRAWVNFNGTGTVAIRASGNVSSITDNGTGNYTVNFTTAMTDANYSVSFGASTYSSIARNFAYGFHDNEVYPLTLNSFRTLCRGSDGYNMDMIYATVSIFR